MGNGIPGRDPALRGDFVNARIRVRMLRFPNRRTPWLTARDWFPESVHGPLEGDLFFGGDRRPCPL